jgi:hypothetical protein
MKTAVTLPCTLLLLFLFTGCELIDLVEPTPPEPPLADCIISDITTVDAEPGHFAKVIMTAKNRSWDLTAYQVGCEIKLKNGNTILERQQIYFGSLDPNESAIGEAWFTTITSHHEYERLEYTLVWY